MNLKKKKLSRIKPIWDSCSDHIHNLSLRSQLLWKILSLLVMQARYHSCLLLLFYIPYNLFPFPSLIFLLLWDQMAWVPMPPTTIYRITPICHTNSLFFTSQSPANSNNLLYMHPSSQIHSPFSHQSVLIRSSFYSRRTSSLLPVPFNAKNSVPAGAEEEEGSRALETVLKLYTAIKNRSIGELSDIIGDECRCVSNFFSIFQPFQGKKVSVRVYSFDFSWHAIVVFFFFLSFYL